MFIKELLNKDPTKRPSAKESLNLGWIELNKEEVKLEVDVLNKLS